MSISQIVLLACVILLSTISTLWLGRRMPRAGEPGRLLWTALVTLSLSLIPLGISLAWMESLSPEPPRTILPLAEGTLVLLALGFAGIRSGALLRRDVQLGWPACVLHTVWQSTTWLGKVLLFLCLLSVLGQLPFRAQTTRALNAQLVNEVQVIEDWYRPSHN